MPHHQNTGGFYIAVLRKKKSTKQIDEDTAESDNEIIGNKRKEFDSELKPQVVAQVSNGSKKQKNESDRLIYAPVSNCQFEEFTKLFGLESSFPRALLTFPEKTSKKCYLLTKTVRDFLEADSKHRLNCLYFGVIVFNRHKCQDFVFPRLAQDGIRYLRQFVPKFIFSISLQEFQFFVTKGGIIFNSELTENLENHALYLDLERGSYCLSYQQPSRQEEFIVIAKMEKSIVVMVPKEDLLAMKLKYSF